MTLAWHLALIPATWALAFIVIHLSPMPDPDSGWWEVWLLGILLMGSGGAIFAVTL